jgi:hypothetical protein
MAWLHTNALLASKRQLRASMTSLTSLLVWFCPKASVFLVELKGIIGNQLVRHFPTTISHSNNIDLQ